jgi:hypothetical protein
MGEYLGSICFMQVTHLSRISHIRVKMSEKNKTKKRVKLELEKERT